LVDKAGRPLLRSLGITRTLVPRELAKVARPVADRD
jgi:hypothetical protein